MIYHLQILFCAILWGFSGPLIRWSALSPLSVIAIRFSLPLFLAYLWLRWIEKGRLQNIGRPLAIASILTALGNALFICAFSLTSISNVLLLLYTRPVITTTLARFTLGESVTTKLWGLLATAFIGAILIITSHDISLKSNDIIGMLLALGAATAIAFSWGIIKMHGYGKHSASEIVFHQNLFGAIIALPLLPSTLYNAPALGIFYVVLYASLIGFLASLLYFSGLRHVKLSHAMPLTYAELVVAVLIGIFVFDESMNWQSISGGLLIIASSLNTLLYIKPQARLPKIP